MTATIEPARSFPHWWALPLILVACAAAMGVDLGARDTTHTMEQIALVSSQEAWLRWAEGDTGALLISSNEFLLRYQKPPLLSWLNLLAWSDLDPATADPRTLVLRARLVGVALALVMLAAIYWIGHSVDGPRLAVLAALAAGSTVLLERQARTASYDICTAAWTAVSCGAALWAMQIARDRPKRWIRGSGWALSGVALALAVMSKTPLAFFFMVLPVATAVILLSKRRGADLLGLAAALAVAVALVGPWYAHVAHRLDSTAPIVNEFTERMGERRPPFYYYLGIFGLVGPWAIWLGAGLVHPFMAYLGPARRRRLVAWIWFAGGMLLMSSVYSKQQRYILPLMPAVALLIAQVFVDHDAARARMGGDRVAGRLVHLHWIVLLGASITIPIVLGRPQVVPAAAEASRSALLATLGDVPAVRDALGADDGPGEVPFAPIGAGAAIAVGVALTLLAVAGLRWHRRWLAFRAGIATGLWGLIALAALWRGYGGAASGVHPIRLTAEAFRTRVGDAPVRVLRDPKQPLAVLNEEFRFYYGRLIRPVRPRELPDLAGDGIVHVLSLDRPSERAALEQAGFAFEGPVQTDKDGSYGLWTRRP